MNDTVMVAIISLIGTIVGTLSGILVTNNLTQYRLKQIEQKIEEYKTIQDRIKDLESYDILMDERIKHIEETITDRLDVMHEKQVELMGDIKTIMQG